MILVYDQILDRVKNFSKYKEVYAPKQCKPLIENFKEDNLQSVSYDVSISNFILEAKECTDIVNINNQYETDKLFEEKDITNGYNLLPNEYIIVRLNEKINMPDDLSGHLRARTSLNKIGLIITNQHINPSYNGNLQFGLMNMSKSTLRIMPGLAIGQVVFEELSDQVKPEKLYRNKGNAKYQGEDSFVKSKIYEEIDTEFMKYLNNL